jgi:ATP-dependent Lon protease
MSGRPVRREVAMTGEITLRGRVLPIGGLKEKVLGAHRAGIKHIVIPKENEADLEDVPEEVQKHLVFHPVSALTEVLKFAIDDGSSLEAPVAVEEEVPATVG